MTVAIDEYDMFGCDDGGATSPDPAFFITIDGSEFGSGELQYSDGPTKPETGNIFSAHVDSTKSSIPIEIQLWEKDPGANPDDHCDINQKTPSRDLQLTLDPRTCILGGNVTGKCNAIVSGIGTEEAARVSFHVEIDNYRTPGLNVRCLHSPVWPSIDQPITIDAFSLDDNNSPMHVDKLEIYLNGATSPVPTMSFEPSPTHVSYTTRTGFDTLSYKCRVSHDDKSTDTGYRHVQVGEVPPGDPTVKIVYNTGDPSKPRLNIGKTPAQRYDVVFLADENSYSSALDPLFLNDVHDAILDGWYGDIHFLKWQADVNFYLARQTGSVTVDPTDPTAVCKFDASSRGIEFADTKIILHRQTTPTGTPRCLGYARYSRNEVQIPATLEYHALFPSVVRHEAGHHPFNLSDEYDGKPKGGYFQPEPCPNVYDTVQECEYDATNLGRVPGSCRQIDENIPDEEWFTSEPNWNDLMNNKGPTLVGDPHAADIRAIDYFFGVRCAESGC